MHITGKGWGKIIGISIVAALLDMVLHALFAPTYPYDYPPSYFVQNGLFQPAAAVSLLITFFLLALVFAAIQERLPGGKVSKGLRFGVAFGGLWFLGVVGMSIFFGAPLSHEVLGGASDCASLIILGVLLGFFTATGGEAGSMGSPGRSIAGILIVAVFFILGQYDAFFLMSEMPYFDLFGPDTFLWTLILAVWAGITYWLLRDGTIRDPSPVKRALFFGGVIIGINWILFNMFVLLFVAAPVSDPLVLAILNIVSIVVGMFVVESVIFRKEAGYPASR